MRAALRAELQRGDRLVAIVLGDGARLEGTGVIPGVVVADDIAPSEGRDPVLERAREVLSEEVRRARDPLPVDR